MKIMLHVVLLVVVGLVFFGPLLPALIGQRGFGLQFLAILAYTLCITIAPDIAARLSGQSKSPSTPDEKSVRISPAEWAEVQRVLDYVRTDPRNDLEYRGPLPNAR